MRRFFGRLAISIALIVVALVALLIAVGYFVFALYLWLVEYLIPPAAAVVAGLIVLVLALVLALILRGSRRRDPDHAVTKAAEAAAELGSLFGDKVQGFANMGRGTSLLTALAAGFAVGVSPKLRGLLWRIIKKMT